MASPRRLQDSLQSQSRTTRELIIFIAALALGLFVIPPLIWLAGTLTLGPYANGGAGALFKDFFRGLASVTPSFWVVALGPYVLILAARGVFSLAFPRNAAVEADGATGAEAQRAQSPRRQAVRGADTQLPDQPSRRQPPQRRADPLFDDLAPEAVEDSAEELPQPPPQPVAPQVRAAPAPQPPRAPPRQAPQMREPPAPPREAPLPQMRATPPARDIPPQMRQLPAQPREAPASLWPANPPQQREAPPQPRQAPPQAREAPPQRRETPRAAPAPRAPAEPSPGQNDVKSTNKPGKKRIPPTIGDL